MMLRHLTYLKYLLRHKWFVFIAGRKLRLSWWRCLVHDLSKFRPSEWVAYARTFYSKAGAKQCIEDAAFHKAWLLHQRRNPHHWQYWVLRQDETADSRFIFLEVAHEHTKVVDKVSGLECPVPALALRSDNAYKCMATCRNMANKEAGVILVEMPREYMLEMIADWVGAGRAISGRWDNVLTWYTNNKDNMLLHPNTCEDIAGLFTYLDVTWFKLIDAKGQRRK